MGQLLRHHLERRAEGSWPLGESVLEERHLPERLPLSLLFLHVHRQHFPFFRTAPEGWKNTVRHNLCFRDSFEKVPVSMQGGARSRPRSCLWKLTDEGHRRFAEEARALASTRLERIRQCMSQPGVRPCHTRGPGEGPEDPDPRPGVHRRSQGDTKVEGGSFWRKGRGQRCSEMLGWCLPEGSSHTQAWSMRCRELTAWGSGDHMM